MLPVCYRYFRNICDFIITLCKKIIKFSKYKNYACCRSRKMMLHFKIENGNHSSKFNIFIKIFISNSRLYFLSYYVTPYFVSSEFYNKCFSNYSKKVFIYVIDREAPHRVHG